MREHQPMTQTMKSTEARQAWGQVLNRVYRTNARVIVEKAGIPVAAIISPQEMDRFLRAEAEREERFMAIDHIRAKNTDKDPEKEEPFITQVIEDVRQERYARPQATQGGR